MARSYLASEIIASLKRRALLSSSGSTPFSDSDWLSMMDEEIRSFIWPLLRECHEDFFVRSVEATLPTATLSEGNIPATTLNLQPRALGESLKAVLYDAGGGEWRKLNRLQAEEQGRGAFGFWIQDDAIRLSPSPSTQSITLRLLYYLRPSMVVPVTSCYAITSNDGNRTVGVTTTGATWTPATNDKVDFVAAKPGLRALLLGATVDKYTPGTPPAATVDIIGALSTYTIGVGSYLCREDETPVPNIPAECFPLLAQQLSMLALEGRSGYSEAKDRRDTLVAQTRAIFTNRVEGNDEVIQNYSAPGWGRRGRTVLP